MSQNGQKAGYPFLRSLDPVFIGLLELKSADFCHGDIVAILAQATAQPQYITSFCQIQHNVSWSLMPQNSQEDKMFLKSKAGHSFTNEKNCFNA
jgi:hypothetical protein